MPIVEGEKEKDERINNKFNLKTKAKINDQEYGEERKKVSRKGSRINLSIYDFSSLLICAIYWHFRMNILSLLCLHHHQQPPFALLLLFPSLSTMMMYNMKAFHDTFIPKISFFSSLVCNFMLGIFFSISVVALHFISYRSFCVCERMRKEIILLSQ